MLATLAPTPAGPLFRRRARAVRVAPAFALVVAGCAAILAEQRSDPSALRRFTTAVCQVVGDDGSSGSGFVVADAEGAGLLVVTALHVVAQGERYSVRLATSSGEHMTVSDVEVVKTSPADDLALLRAPLAGHLAGLELATDTPSLGAPVFAYGYPYVDGSAFELTLEQGTVTAQHRSVGGREFIQTNANINPGNSGGPALDGSGRVLGVVTAKAAHQQGIGLLVPAIRVAELQRAYRAPRQEPRAEAEGRLHAFLAALEYRQSGDAAGFLSQRFLRVCVFPAFKESMQSAQSKLTVVRNWVRRTRGIEFDQLAEEVQYQVLDEVLKPEEKASVLAVREYQGNENVYAAMQMYFAYLAGRIFGDVERWQLVSMQLGADARRMGALVVGERHDARVRYHFSLVYQRGDWEIDDISVL